MALRLERLRGTEEKVSAKSGPAVRVDSSGNEVPRCRRQPENDHVSEAELLEGMQQKPVSTTQYWWCGHVSDTPAATKLPLACPVCHGTVIISWIERKRIAAPS